MPLIAAAVLPFTLTAAAAGATAAAGIYGANKQASTAKDAATLQTDAANHASDQQAQATAVAQAFQEKQAEAGWRDSDAAQRANYAQYTARYNAAKGLGAEMGFNLPDPASYTGSEDPHYDTGGSAPPTAPGASPTSGAPAASSPGNAAALQALLQGGMDPQAAVAKFNQQYGRSTGNEAVYYDPSQHGGTATIGLPDAYLSQEANGWQITPRSGGGASASGSADMSAPLSSSVGSYLNGPSVAPLQTPQNFRLQGVSSYLGRA